MTRLASALSLALVFTLVSCGDDDKPKTDASAGTGGTAGSTGGSGGSTGGSGGSTGGSGGVGGGGGTTACTGTFMGINQGTLGAAIAANASSDKKCAAAADVALICTGNIATIAGMCGQGCASMPSAMVKGCVSTCIQGMVKLTPDCSDCYAGTVACTTANCLSQCLANPAAPACVACQIEKGCRGDFLKCSGLPSGAAPGDGGAGDGGGNTGDGGAIDAASTEGGTTADGGVDAAATSDTAAADTAATTD